MVIDSSATLELVDYFAAPRDAVGFVRDFRGRVRKFHAAFVGRREGMSLTIDEHMVYDDGETMSRQWRIDPAEGGWTARAGDVVGTARIVREAADRCRWTYGLRLAGMTLALSDRMVLLAPGVLGSETRVGKLGFTVARVQTLYVPSGALGAIAAL